MKKNVLRRWMGLAALVACVTLCAACAGGPAAMATDEGTKPLAGGALITATPTPASAPTMPDPTPTPLPASLPAAKALLRPANQTVTGATPVLVEVVLEDVRDLYGAQVSLRFDPKILQVKDMDPDLDGVQIRAGNAFPKTSSFVALNRADNAQGRIDFAVTLLNPAQPVQGRALVAIFPVIAVGEGTTTLEWETVLLADRNANALRVASEPLTLSAKP